MSTATSFSCPRCGERYAPLLFISWAKTVKCTKCRQPLRVSVEAFRANCMMVFAVWSFLPAWLISTIVFYCVELPDSEGIGFWGRLGLGAISALVISCLFMAIGQLFGSFADAYRTEHGSQKKGKRKRKVECSACGELSDPSEGVCEHCGEELEV